MYCNFSGNLNWIVCLITVSQCALPIPWGARNAKVSYNMATHLQSEMKKINSILHLWAPNVGRFFRYFEPDRLAKLCWGWDKLQKSLYLLKEAFCQISKVSKSTKLPFELAWMLADGKFRRLPWNPFQRTADVQFRGRSKNLNTNSCELSTTLKNSLF